MSDATQLQDELKHLIVETLKLEDVEPEEIEPETPLFGEGLELDSIDALEIGLAIQKKYGISFEAQDENVQSSFASVKTLAEFVTNSLENSSAGGAPAAS